MSKTKWILYDRGNKVIASTKDPKESYKLALQARRTPGYTLVREDTRTFRTVVEYVPVT